METGKVWRMPFVKGIWQPYATDMGCDIGELNGSPAIAVADMSLPYSEGIGGCGRPHTPWTKCAAHPHDTPGCIYGELKTPVLWDGKQWRGVAYRHLSSLAKCVRQGIDLPYPVSRGMMIGHTGTGNDVPHLHFEIWTRDPWDGGEWMDPFRVEACLKAIAV